MSCKANVKSCRGNIDENLLLEEKLKETQDVTKEKLVALKKLVNIEKQRLDLFRSHIELEREAYLMKLQEMYTPPPPPPMPPCICPKQQDTFKENMGEYTFCVTKKEDFQAEDQCLKMEWTDDEANKTNKEAGQNDVVLIQMEKQLDEDMLLKMQLQAKGKPRRVCPCKAKENGVVQPFPPSPHSHTTYFKTELTITDIKQRHDMKATCKMKRIDKIRNMHDPPSFCTATECNE